jgi:hypothetical protein
MNDPKVSLPQTEDFDADAWYAGSDGSDPVHADDPGLQGQEYSRMNRAARMLTAVVVFVAASACRRTLNDK